MEQKTQNKMGVMPEGRLLFSMSVPLCISMLMQALYNLVDSVFVSRLGEDALTAVSLAYPVQMLMIAVAVGTGVGMNSLISRRLGERRREEATLAANNGLLLLLLSALAFALFGLFCTDPFFALFTDKPAIREMGTTYLSVCCTLCFGVFLQVGCERIMQAQGQNVAAMAMQLVGALFNIIFDPILIFGLLGFPAMGIAGAAWATVGGQLLGMVCCFVVLLVRKFEVTLCLPKCRPVGRVIRDIYQVGIPSAIMQAIGTVMNLAMNALLIAYSSTAVAVFGVYFKIQSVVFMPVFGMTNAAMSIMAYNYGARCRSRLMRTWKLMLLAALAMMLAGTIVFQLLPDRILLLFEASEDMLGIGVPALRVISSCFLFAAVGISASTFFQAVGQGIYSMLLSLIRQLVVLVPAAYTLSALFHSLDAVWLSFPVAEGVALATSLFLFRSVYNRQIRPLDGPLRE